MSQQQQTPKQLLEALNEFMFANPAVMQSFEQFALDHCDVFDYIPDRSEYESSENKLSYTAVYKEFEEFLETQMASFLQSQNCSYDDFIEACRAVDAEQDMSASPQGKSAFDMGPEHHFLLSIADFNVFKAMMLDMKKMKVESQQ
jgi:hypothetical protein